jgi:hypothetical protein
MPILTLVIGWFARLSFMEVITLGTLGIFGIKTVSSEVKSTIQEAVIPAAVIFGVIYFVANKSKT